MTEEITPPRLRDARGRFLRATDDATPGRIDAATDEAATDAVAAARARPLARRAAPPAHTTHDLVMRTRAALARHLDALTAQPDADADQAARLLANLTRALNALRDLERQTKEDKHAASDSEGEPPLDIAEFRAELVRRLDRLRAEGNAD